MKVTSKSIADFLDGKNRSFLIPVYQRNYDWNFKDQCQTLWDDLNYIINHDNKPHFFGSIVSVIDQTSGDYIIIDGQQRITTISLLMLAIARRAKEFRNVVIENEAETAKPIPDPDEVLGYCIDFKKQRKLKLKLLRGDMAAYQCLIDDDRCPNLEKNHIIQNYKFFYSSLGPDNIYKIYEAVKRLIVVDIMLGKDDDNPQQVFESLNSKGLELSDADKIRNYILIDLPYDKQEELYKKYWEPMERNCGTSPKDTTMFIWNFLAYKTNKKANLSDIYTKFKNYKSNNISEEEILIDLYNVSETYCNVITKNYKEEPVLCSKLDNLLTNITQVVIPMFLDLFQKYEQGKISPEEVIEIIDTIESYFIRRTVCRLKPIGDNKFFLMNIQINSLLTKYRNASYADMFKYLLSVEKGANRFPDDNEVLEALKGDIYTPNAKICKYVLSQLEQSYNPKERVDTLDLTVEHVMPQTLNKEWRIDLGEDAEYIHAKYLHSLGNLTLTGYNSEYSNKPFVLKKTIGKGFNNSPLYLNEYIKSVDVWSENQIIERGNLLSAQFLNIWPVYKPLNQYPVNTSVEKIKLDDPQLDVIVIGKKPKSFYFLNYTDEDVCSWKDLYIQIINMLYNDDNYRAEMQHVFKFGNHGNFEGIISNHEENRGKHNDVLWEQIIPGEQIYFYTCKGAIGMLNAIRKWLNHLKISQSDLEITFK